MNLNYKSVIMLLKQVVLVVEDEPLLLLMATDVVEEAGFDTVEARNADDALRLLDRGDDIHAIFTDVHIPGILNGMKLDDSVRERCTEVGIPGAAAHHLTQARITQHGEIRL